MYYNYTIFLIFIYNIIFCKVFYIMFYVKLKNINQFNTFQESHDTFLFNEDIIFTLHFFFCLNKRFLPAKL